MSKYVVSSAKSGIGWARTPGRTPDRSGSDQSAPMSNLTSCSSCCIATPAAAPAMCRVTVEHAQASLHCTPPHQNGPQCRDPGEASERLVLYAGGSGMTDRAGAGVAPQQRLSDWTTLGVGGPADAFVEVADVASLADALAEAEGHDSRVLVLGGGSNIVVADEGFRGTVVHIAMKGFRLENTGRRGPRARGGGRGLVFVRQPLRSRGLGGDRMPEWYPGPCWVQRLCKMSARTDKKCPTRSCR